MVVAACAVDGEAEGATGQHIDAVINHIIAIVLGIIFAAEGEETHGSKVTVAGLLLVGGDLLDEKLVVRLVFIE